MESSTDSSINEHDYSSRLEVPVEAIKQEVIDALEDASFDDPDCVRVPVILRDCKPKLRMPKPPKPRQPWKEKMPKLLPRPDVPKVPHILPPPLKPGLGSNPPPNCKGVLVVQDVKFCTMYVPKNTNSAVDSSTLPLHSLPVASLPINSIPINSIPINSMAMGSVPFNLAALKNLPTNATAFNVPAMNSPAVKPTANKVSASSIPVKPNIENAAMLNSVLVNSMNALTTKATGVPVSSTAANKSNVSSVPATSSVNVTTTANSVPCKSATVSGTSAKSILRNRKPVSTAALNCVSISSASSNTTPGSVRTFPSIASLRSDPPISVVSSNETAKQNKMYPLLGDVQKILCEILPPFWFSSAEKSGVNVMLLSYGKEKAIQRRVYVSIGGDVEISVHCKPLLDNFVNDVVKRAGIPVRLTVSTIKIFSDWVLNLVQVLRDYQVCTGLECPNLEDNFLQCDNLLVDDNPYQEGRYLKALRSKNCLRLVDPGRRRCAECSKMFSLSRKSLKLLSDCNKSKIISSQIEPGEIVFDGMCYLSPDADRKDPNPPDEHSSMEEGAPSSATTNSKRRKKAAKEKQRKKKTNKEGH